MTGPGCPPWGGPEMTPPVLGRNTARSKSPNSAATIMRTARQPLIFSRWSIASKPRSCISKQADLPAGRSGDISYVANESEMRISIAVLTMLVGVNAMAIGEKDAGTQKRELEQLLSATLPFAEKMLTNHGEFYPYGATMSSNGKISAVGGYTATSAQIPPKSLTSSKEHSGNKVKPERSWPAR